MILCRFEHCSSVFYIEVLHFLQKSNISSYLIFAHQQVCMWRILGLPLMQNNLRGTHSSNLRVLTYFRCHSWSWWILTVCIWIESLYLQLLLWPKCDRKWDTLCAAACAFLTKCCTINSKFIYLVKLRRLRHAMCPIFCHIFVTVKYRNFHCCSLK